MSFSDACDAIEVVKTHKGRVLSKYTLHKQQSDQYSMNAANLWNLSRSYV